MNIFRLEEYLAQYEFSAKYLLCCSDAESFGLSELLDMACVEEKRLWDSLRLGYTEVSGAPLLREAVAKGLYEGLTADHILMFAGAEEGIFCALHTLIEKGDHIIVLTPCYQSLIEVPKLKGARVTEIVLQEANGWRIDVAQVAAAMTVETKCIIINFPHNPTGQVIEQVTLQALVNVCAQKGIWLFSDEVYRFLGQPDRPWASPAADLYDKAISVGVMSKAFGLAGLRVGWIACQNKSMLQKIAYMKHYASICNSAPSEILSLIALNNKELILARNNQIIIDNLKLLDQFFSDYVEDFSWVRPQGGCVGFVKYEKNESVDEFCDRLVKKRNVLLMPASIYHHNTQHFRIGFGRKNMPECLEQLRLFLAH